MTAPAVEKAGTSSMPRTQRVTCQKCRWEAPWRADGPGPIVELMAHYAAEHVEPEPPPEPPAPRRRRRNNRVPGLCHSCARPELVGKGALVWCANCAWEMELPELHETCPVWGGPPDNCAACRMRRER